MGDTNEPLIPGLTDDISLECIAGVPEGDNNSLLLVSKVWYCAFEGGKVYEVDFHFPCCT